MASDLSILIQDGLCNTLQNLLGTDAKLNEINKVHKKDLEDLELLKIESEFEFDQLSTVFSFIVPARSASLIFNIQMGDTETEPSLSIDDDTIDAIKEFISTVSGGLTVVMNGAELEDLSSSKFNIKVTETLQSNTTINIDNMYKFTINLEENEIIIFISFDKTIIPYINDITMKPISEYPEDVKVEEEIEEVEVEDDIQDNKIDDNSEEAQDNKKSKDNTQEVVNDENTIEDEIENSDDDKPEDKKLKMLVMGVAALLAITILSGIIMYFMGIFDPEPVPIKKVESNTTKETKEKVSIIKYKTIKKIDFKISDINIARLNIRLEALTKYRVLSKKELETQALAEKDRLFRLNKEKKLLEFSKKNKEEPLVIETNNKVLIKQKIINSKDKEIQNIKLIDNNLNKDNEKLLFILSDSLKYKFFKDLVIENETKQARISICNDMDGRTTIFIGPFENNKLQMKMQSSIKENDKNIKISISNITQEEFDTRCNF